MKKNCLKVIAVYCIIVFTALFAVSCSDITGKREFRKTMLSDYTAEIDYLIDLDGNPVSGSAVITKDDGLCLDILSPDPYSGISLMCDTSGNSELVSISYMGIKTNASVGAMEKLVFLMNVMSERTACALEGQSGNAYRMCEEYESADYPNAKPYEVSFSHENTDYLFIYDSLSGMPLELFADNGYCKAEIKVRKLKTEESVSEE